MKIISIAAAAKNGTIGANGLLPWHIPEDLKFFKDSTRGHTVLMGRKTFESIKVPLPKRLNVVLTRDAEFKATMKEKFKDVLVFDDLSAAVAAIKLESEKRFQQDCFIIGGAQIYEQAMSFVNEVWLTHIARDFEGDTVFPYIKDGVFTLAEGTEAVFECVKKVPQVDLNQPFKYEFAFYQRKGA